MVSFISLCLKTSFGLKLRREERAVLKFPRSSGVIEVKSPIWQFFPVSVMANSCTASSKIHRFCFLSFYLERVEEDGAV